MLVALAVLGLQPEAGAAERYVPSSGWVREDSAKFYEGWYGGQLRAMGERPLAGTADLRGLRARFRLLVLPNYGRARAYRFDERADGSVALRAVQLDSPGGYAPGKVASERRLVLAPAEARRLARAVARAGLGARPREPRFEGVVENADGSQTLTLCLHATHYVLERLTAEGRVFLSRDACEVEPPQRRLIDAVLAIAPKFRFVERIRPSRIKPPAD